MRGVAVRPAMLLMHARTSLPPAMLHMLARKSSYNVMFTTCSMGAMACYVRYAGRSVHAGICCKFAMGSRFMHAVKRCSDVASLVALHASILFTQLTDKTMGVSLLTMTWALSFGAW